MSAAPGLVLALDASSPLTSLALGRIGADADELLASSALEARANQTSSILDERISRLLAEAGVAPRELGAIACGRGPGTGARP